MSLAKIGNLATALKTGTGITASLQAFGSVAAAAKALSRYGNIDMDVEGLQYLSQAFTGKKAQNAIVALNATTTTTTIANVASGLKTSLTSAFTGLAAKLGMSAAALGTTLGVAAGAALATGIYKAWQNSLDEKVEEAANAYTEYNTETKEIEEQIETVRELRAELDAGNLSSEEEYSIRSQILDIQNTLVDTYGSQVNGINLVNGALEKELELVNSVSSAEARKLYSENEDVYERAIKKMEKEDTYSLGEFQTSLDQGNNNAIDDILEIVSKYENEGVVIVEHPSKKKNFYEIEFNGTAEEANNIVMDINDRVQALYDGTALANERYGKEMPSAFTVISKNTENIYDKTQDVVDKYSDAYYAAGELLLNFAEYTDVDTALNDYNDALTAYNEALLSYNVDDASSVQTLMEAKDAYNVAYDTARDAAEQADALSNTNVFSNIFKQTEDGLYSSLDDTVTFEAALKYGDFENADEISKSLQTTLQALKDQGLTSEEFYELLGYSQDDSAGPATPLTKAVNDVVDTALSSNIIKDTSTESIQSLIDILTSIHVIKGELEEVESSLFADLFKGSTEEAEAFDDIIDNFQSDISDLNSAFESLKNGELRGSELTDLLQKFPELNDYVDDLNTGLTKISSDKITEVIKAIKKETEGITDESEIQKVNQFIQGLIEQVNYSTSDNIGLRQAIKDALFDDEDLSPAAAAYRQQVYNELMDEFGDDNISLQAIAKIVLNPEVSLNTKDIKNQIDTAKIDGVIASSLNALEKNEFSQNKHDVNIAYAEALRSYKETLNGFLTEQDYSNMNKELDEANALLYEKIDAIDDILNVIDKDDPSTWGNLTKEDINSYEVQRMELLADIISNNAEKIENNREQESLPLARLQKEYDKLSRNATILENNLSDKDTYGQKVIAEDYYNLIAASKAMDNNLNSQKKELELLIKKETYTEEYQEQLNDVEDSLRDNQKLQYEWNKALKNLPLTHMENLSSALSAMFDELASDTGITIDTVEELATQFSDIADINIQDTLYRTADGLKIDTDILQEFTEAEYKFTMSDFETSIDAQRKAIADYQKQIGADNTDSTLENMQDNLEGLLNRQAQYFAAYQEQMQQFSKYNAIQIAKNTANAGDEYMSMIDEFETAVEAYNNGLIGTDDFKTVAAYFSPNGFDDDKNFSENYSKIQRYLTEDNTGPKNFLNDLISKGYASYDNKSKQYQYDIPNMRKAALDMGIGEEFMQSLFGRLEDYGFTNLFVGSIAEGTLKTEELAKELSEAKIRMAELQAQGANQNILDSQQQYIDDLIVEQESLQDAIQSYTIASTKDYIEGIVSGKEYINTLKEYAENALTPEEAQYYIDAIQRYADKYGITLNADFAVDEESYNELLSSLAIGSWENPLSAEDLGYTEGAKGAEVFLSTQNKIIDTYAENKEKLGELSQFTAAELYQLVSGLGNGVYDGDTDALHHAEDILEEIKQEANLTDEEVKTLVKALISLGYVDNPEWEAKIDTTEIDEAEKRAYYLQGGTISYQMSTNLTDGAGELSSFVNGMTQGVSTSITVGVNNMDEAESLVEILSNVPPDTSCAVNCSVSNQDELDYITAQIAAYNEQNGTEFILNATLDGSDETAKSEIDDIVEHANSSQAKLTVRADTQKAFYAVNNAVSMINKKSATVTIKADCFNLFKTVNTAIDMINKKTATVTVYKKTATTGQVAELYTGTMTSIASHANGTVPYNVLNTAPAYANGKVSLQHDETALVNELGQESRISNGVWSLLPPGMHFEHLKKGDIILNHKQTADLLKYGKASGTGHVRGYANGTLPDDYIPAFAGGTTSGNGGGGWGGTLGTGITLGSSTTTTSSSDAVTSAAESAEDLFDWIEVLLTRLQSKTDKFIQKAENAIKLSSSLKYYDKAIANISEQISANEAGAKRYAKQAQAVELSNSIKKLVKTGKIDITKYDESTQEKISDYQTWYEKYLDCLQNIADLEEQQVELAQTKLDTIIDKYDLIVNRFDSYISKYEAELDYRETAGYSNVGSKQKSLYQASIDKENTIIERYQKAQAALANEIESQLASGLMTKNDDRWREAQIQLQEYNTSILEAKAAIEEWEQSIRAIKVTKLQRALDTISRWADQLSGILNLKEARGQNITESDYMSQVTANNDQIYTQYKLLNAYLEEQANYEYGSEKWEEYAEKIADCKNEINSLLVSNEELKDSIVDERWETFNKLQDEIDNTITEIDYLRNALNASITSTGEFTSDGYANIALIGKAISLEKQTVADYNKAIQKLNKEYKNGNIDQNEYNERLLEYQSIIRDSASAVEDYKDELIDLYKEQISARNDVLLENIDLWKKAAEEQENYYDYSKQLKNQRKTIDSLKSQAAALEGVASASGKAKLAKIKAELAEAEEELEDTKHDHEYELKISGYETLSDDVSKQLELIEAELEVNATMQQNVVNVMLGNITSGYSEAYTTINDLITNTGLSISTTTTTAIDGLSSVKNAALLVNESIKETIDYAASTTASSVDTSKIVTNQTSSTSTSGTTITTNDAEKAASTTASTSNANTTKTSSSSGTNTGSATSITLSKTSASIKVGGTVALTASCTPVNANVSYAWKSSNTSVAKVSNGTVTGKKAGTATITVTDTVSGKTATCKVTVKATTTTSTSTSSTKNNTTSTTTASDIWANIPKDTSEKGSSSLDKNTSIMDRMKYYGYTGNYTTQKQLWSNLKGSGAYTGTASQNAWMIEQLKKAGYSTGGVVSGDSIAVLNRAAKANGDDGIGILSKGEVVMPTRFTELMPQGLKILEAVSKIDIPTHNVSSQAPIINSNIVFNVDQIANDIDLDAFSKKIQKEVSQNIVREVRKLR